LTTLAVEPPEAPRRERPLSLLPATPEDLAQSTQIFEATDCAVSVVTGCLGGWDLHARDGRTIVLVAVTRGEDVPDLCGPQYLGRDGWPSSTRRLLHLYGPSSPWPTAILLA
jgi:hypothetical protein